jgi:hypothetical protein
VVEEEVIGCSIMMMIRVITMVQNNHPIAQDVLCW